MLRKVENRRIRGAQRMKWMDGITKPMDMNLSKLRKIVEVRGISCVIVHGVTKSWT